MPKEMHREHWTERRTKRYWDVRKIIKRSKILIPRKRWKMR